MIKRFHECGAEIGALQRIEMEPKLCRLSISNTMFLGFGNNFGTRLLVFGNYTLSTLTCEILSCHCRIDLRPTENLQWLQLCKASVRNRFRTETLPRCSAWGRTWVPWCHHRSIM